MGRVLHFLLGPECLWTVFYGLVLAIGKWSASPVKSMDGFWLTMTYVVSLALIPMTFALYYVPGVIKSWLLLRIWISGLVGGHIVLNTSLLAHSEQGPGVGTAYIVGMGLVFMVLVAGSIWALIRFSS